MSQIYVWPAPGQLVPFPDAGGANLGVTGSYVEPSDYILDEVREGRLRTQNPSSSGFDPAPKTGIVDYVSSALVISVSYDDGARLEVIYRDGGFLDPFTTSSLNLTTGVYSLVRDGGWPPTASVFVDAPHAGTPPIWASAWYCDPARTFLATVPQVAIGQNYYFDPEDIAAQAIAQKAQGPLVLSLRAPPGLIQDADKPVRSADAIAAGAPTDGWANFRFDHGVTAVRALLGPWLNSYIAAGGPEPLSLSLDEEGIGIEVTEIDPTVASNKWFNAQSVWEDPTHEMFRGFVRQGIAGVNYTATFPNVASYYYSGNAQYWQIATGECASRAMNQAYLELLRQHWPSIDMSNYASYVQTLTESILVKYWSAFPTPSTAYPGSVAAPTFYGEGGNLLGIDATSFDVMTYQTDFFRSMRRSDLSVRYTPWVAYASLIYVPPGYGADPRYALELIYHLALAGAEGFLWFNPPGCPEAEDLAGDAVFYELQQRFGNKPRTAVLLSSLNWSSEPIQVVSGMRDGNGLYHWRCTFGPAVTAVTANGVSCPIVSGRRGVWYTTLTSTPPTFVVT